MGGRLRLAFALKNKKEDCIIYVDARISRGCTLRLALPFSLRAHSALSGRGRRSALACFGPGHRALLLTCCVGVSSHDSRREAAELVFGRTVSCPFSVLYLSACLRAGHNFCAAFLRRSDCMVASFVFRVPLRRATGSMTDLAASFVFGSRMWDDLLRLGDC